MLKLWIGRRTPDMELLVPLSFGAFYEDEWFDDPRVKQIIKDIDKSDAISFRQIDSPFLGLINYSDLSGGALLLIMLIFVQDYAVSSLSFGNNCTKWLTEIAKDVDITIIMEHLLSFPQDVEALILNDNSVIKSRKELTFKYIDLEPKTEELL